MADQSLLGTLTGERFQPVRLHYRVLNHPGLKRAFEKLRCLEYDAPRKRWVWLYAHEAKNLRFHRSYAQFPKELHPIVIGAFFLRTKETLLLDLRSCERALLAIPFFDTHLPRKLVALEEAEIVNRLFPVTKTSQQLTPDALFDAQIGTGIDPESLVRRLADKTADVRDPEEKIKIVLEDFEAPRKGAVAGDRTASRPLCRGRHCRFQAGITAPADRRHGALAGQPRVHAGRRDPVALRNVLSGEDKGWESFLGLSFEERRESLRR